MFNNQKDPQESKHTLSEQQQKQYFQLFINRNDTYGVQKNDGSYDRIKSPLDETSLFSTQTIGTYLLDTNSTVILACIDIDIDKAIHENRDLKPTEWEAGLESIRKYSKSLYEKLRELGMSCYPEFSGFKGYHIWMFFDKPMQAADVRIWMKELQTLFPDRPSEINIELFPKQGTIPADGFGNLIKLPLQKHLKSGNYTYFLDEDFQQISGLPEIIRTDLVQLPSPPVVVKERVKTFQQPQSKSKVDLAVEKLPVVIERCAYLQKLLKRIEDEKHLDHGERIWLANILKPFGSEILHKYFSKLSDYDKTFTDSQIASLTSNPSTCASSPMCAAQLCPLMEEIGKASPIAFSYKVMSHSDIDPSKPWVFFNSKAQRHHYIFKGEQYGIPKEELKTLYSNFKLKPPKIQKMLFPKFDPNDPWYINLFERSINYFEETEYMRLKRTTDVIEPLQDFGNIWSLLSNLIPDEAERNHFVNWLATILNTRKKMRTSFVFKGVQGAGKNAFFQHVIAPLLGKGQCRVVKNEDLIESFNPWMKQAFFIAFDEVAHDNKSRNTLNSKLKALITDDKVTLNDKNDKAYQIENNMNCVFFSNVAVPLVVEQSDRRFTIIRTGGNLTKQGFFDGDEFFKRISNELMSFAQYLTNFAFDENQANTVLDTEEKRSLVAAAIDRFEDFATKLKSNDGKSLKDMIDNENTYPYDINFDGSLNGKMVRSKARELFVSIYGEQITTHALTKKLAVHGIRTTKSNVHYYEW